MTIAALIGDYRAFFSDVFQEMKTRGIDIRGMPVSHLLYRVATLQEYEIARNHLKAFCRDFVEAPFNGRAIAIFVLKEPLILAEGFGVSVIELPAPKIMSPHPTGLESMGMVVGKALPEFIVRHASGLIDINDQSASISLAKDRKVKFCALALQEKVQLQGCEMAAL